MSDWRTVGVALLLAICMCTSSPTEHAGTETGNGSAGRVVCADGSGAAGAVVTVVPVDYNELEPPPDAFIIAAARTDSAGQYAFEYLIDGCYNLYASHRDGKAYLDSLWLPSTNRDSIPMAVLRRPGAFTGQACYSSGKRVEEGSVVLQGSRFSARIGAVDGTFAFPSLAPGTYAARVITPAGGYFDVPFTVRVAEGDSTFMPAPYLMVSTAVTALAAAGDGGLWVGTDNGAARRSAESWRPFGLHNGLSSSHINCLTVDSHETVWVGTAFRLASIDTTGVLHNFTSGPVTATINVRALAVGRDDALWVGTSDGLFELNDGRWEQASVCNDSLTRVLTGYADNELTAVTRLLCTDSIVWAGTQHGLYRRDSAGSWRPKPALVYHAVSALAPHEFGRVWVGTNHGLFLSGPDTTVPKPIPDSLQGVSITALCRLGDDSLAVGTVDGLYIISTGSIWSRLEYDGSPYVTALAVDHDNVLWAGTSDGLVRFEGSQSTAIR
ncbi:MAG: hypothetical protein GF331_12585 [Chitinivibrionales bacterium]|nr:hypothetical protein [Chitinivibrionales bacterium]